jgi:tripartite-type tricarboxylate transporter receptor subunit TctC
MQFVPAAGTVAVFPRHDRRAWTVSDPSVVAGRDLDVFWTSKLDEVQVNMEVFGMTRRTAVEHGPIAPALPSQMIAARMSGRFLLGGLTLLALSIIGARVDTGAQSFPSNAIRIVVPAGAGSTPDVLSRIIATELSEAEGWRVVVDNRPGALQTIGIADVMKQPADSILAMGMPMMAAPALLPNMGLKPDSDLTPIIKISTSYNVLVVNPSLPVKSVSELVAAITREPSKYNFASGGFGTPAHLIGEMFKLQTGVRATHVPHPQGGQQRIVDLLNGTTQFDFRDTLAVVDLIATGKLRAIAVTAPKRVAALKDVPTVVEQGFPDLVVEDWAGFAARVGTSNDIVRRLNVAINKALNSSKVREGFANVGAAPSAEARPNSAISSSRS